MKNPKTHAIREAPGSSSHDPLSTVPQLPISEVTVYTTSFLKCLLRASTSWLPIEAPHLWGYAHNT